MYRACKTSDTHFFSLLSYSCLKTHSPHAARGCKFPPSLKAAFNRSVRKTMRLSFEVNILIIDFGTIQKVQFQMKTTPVKRDNNTAFIDHFLPEASL